MPNRVTPYRPGKRKCNSLVRLDLVLEPDPSGRTLPPRHTHTRAAHHDVARPDQLWPITLEPIQKPAMTWEAKGKNVDGEDTKMSKDTHKSIPKIPIPGSYLIPRSMCSSIPKPKLPVSEKFLRGVSERSNGRTEQQGSDLGL